MSYSNADQCAANLLDAVEQDFAKFNAATRPRLGDMIAEYAARLAGENIFYVEIMTSPGMGDAP